MSTERNKELVAEFFARFTENDIAGALDRMADDATWWIAGKPGLATVSGLHTKEQIGRVFYGIAGRLKNGLKMTVKGAVAEGNKVAVELESYGELDNGRIYNNEYHVLMTIREDGKIGEVHEYLDTHHVHATWFQP